MKILITGREGQLARCLAERAALDPTVSLVHAARPEVDLATPGQLDQAIARARPDIVINTAAYTRVDDAEEAPDLAFRINADAAGETAMAAARLGIPIIQISTDYVFDGGKRTPYAEDDATGPINLYGRSKLAGEELVRAANADHCIVRTSWLYSPFGRNFVRTMVAAGAKGGTLSVVGDQFGSPTSAFDLAEGIMRIASSWTGKQPVRGTYHLANRGEASWFDLAVAVQKEAAARGMGGAVVKPIMTSEWPTRAQRPIYSVLDTNKIETAMGWTMPDWRVAVATVVERLEMPRSSTQTSH
jgi:dTDP-4-dehydrorhamnose reductase